MVDGADTREGLRDLDRPLAVAERGRAHLRPRPAIATAAGARGAAGTGADAEALAMQFAVAPQTATALLRALRAAGLVAEITGRRSFRTFAVISA